MNPEALPRLTRLRALREEARRRMLEARLGGAAQARQAAHDARCACRDSVLALADAAPRHVAGHAGQAAAMFHMLDLERAMQALRAELAAREAQRLACDARLEAANEAVAAAAIALREARAAAERLRALDGVLAAQAEREREILQENNEERQAGARLRAGASESAARAAR